MTKLCGFVQKLYIDKQLRIEQGEILWWHFAVKMAPGDLILLTRHPGVEQCFSCEGEHRHSAWMRREWYNEY